MKGWENVTTGSLVRGLQSTQTRILDKVRPPTRLPAPMATPEEAAAWERIERLAVQHGWADQSFWHHADGLCCLLVRGTDVLYVQVLRPFGTDTTAPFRRALQASSKCEVLVCRPTEGALDQIEARLAQRRQP